MADPNAGNRSLTKFFAGRNVPCPNCGYNLRDQRTGRCPECGRVPEMWQFRVSPALGEIIASVIALGTGLAINAVLMVGAILGAGMNGRAATSALLVFIILLIQGTGLILLMFSGVRQWVGTLSPAARLGMVAGAWLLGGGGAVAFLVWL